MKNTHLLLSLSTAVLLTACGGGGGGGVSATTNPTGSVSGLTQNYTVPASIKADVDEALTRYVDWEGVAGEHAATTGNKTYDKGDGIKYSELPLGYTERLGVGSDKTYATASGTGYIYRMPYSVVLSDTVTSVKLAPGNSIASYSNGVTAFGYHTKKLPTAGKATYTGVALSDDDKGVLNLSVDFDKQITNGKITGLKLGEVTLNKGTIQSVKVERVNKHLQDIEESHIGFKGSATIANANIVDSTITAEQGKATTVTKRTLSPSEFNFAYQGLFFGPNAEEVGGIVEAKSKTDPYDYPGEFLSFGGQRGEIKK